VKPFEGLVDDVYGWFDAFGGNDLGYFLGYFVVGEAVVEGFYFVGVGLG
jgi:hypothetical protein